MPGFLRPCWKQAGCLWMCICPLQSQQAFYMDQNKLGVVACHLPLPAGSGRFFFQLKISTMSILHLQLASLWESWHELSLYVCMLLGFESWQLLHIIFKYSNPNRKCARPDFSSPSIRDAGLMVSTPEKAPWSHISSVLAWNKSYTFWSRDVLHLRVILLQHIRAEFDIITTAASSIFQLDYNYGGRQGTRRDREPNFQQRMGKTRWYHCLFRQFGT